jgi:hypothetical protein
MRVGLGTLLRVISPTRLVGFAPRLRMGYIRLFGFRREDDRPATRTITNPVNETQPPEAVLYAIHAH